jgi:hypothetical protein
MTTQTATADSPITPAQVTHRDTSRAMLWTGRVLTALIVLFMLFDAYGKLAKIQPVLEGTVKVGYPESTIRPIGAAALLGAVLYAIPQTSVLGAIVLTGFLGGAVATHVRIADNNYFFAIIFGIVTWLGIYFRDARLRRLIPLRQ